MTKNLIMRIFVIFSLILFCINYSLSVENFSYSNVDSKVIDDLRVNEWTPVIVRLNDNSGIYYTLNIKENREIYKQKAKYFNEVEDNILSILSEEEFVLKFKFSIINQFSGYITKEGLKKLVHNSQVRYINSDYLKGSGFLDDSIPLINTDKVWQSTIDGNNITGISQTVCIIDSGINDSHPAFLDPNKILN